MQFQNDVQFPGISKLPLGVGQTKVSGGTVEVEVCNRVAVVIEEVGVGVGLVVDSQPGTFHA